ncbi:MAG: FecR domain-containing protein [Mariniphaga sp.]|nr:FecR domain-containing protein [Mariniphaga sp.]
MKAKHSIEKPEWDLVTKFLASEAKTAEKEAVEKWASQSDQNKHVLEQAKVLYQKTGEYYQVKRFDSDAAWEKTQQRISSETISNAPREKPRNVYISTFYKYAAIFILALLVGTAGYYFGLKNQLQNVYSEVISAEKQVVNEYILPDGSVVALNSNSKLQFPKKFKNSMREVTITGEAFFDVLPDAEKPFIINAGNAQVKVLGTSFNINAYPENETVEVVVKTGTVQVISTEKRNTSETAEIVLNSGEKGTFINSLGKLEKGFNSDPNYLAWKTHNLVFENTPLREVVQYLNKTYHTDIQLKEENLNKLVLTAQFEKKPVDFILNVIQLTFDLQLEQAKNIYILSENETLNK